MMSEETFRWRSGLLDISTDRVTGSAWVIGGNPAIWGKKTLAPPVKHFGFLTSKVQAGLAQRIEQRPRGTEWFRV